MQILFIHFCHQFENACLKTSLAILRATFQSSWGSYWIYLYLLQYSKYCNFMIHEVDPQSRSIVITIFTRTVPYVCPYFSNSRKTKQILSENSDGYWPDCGSGRVDPWWHTCLVLFALAPKIKIFHSLVRLDNKKLVTRRLVFDTKQEKIMALNAREILNS